MKTRIILGLTFIALVGGLFYLDHFLVFPYGFLCIGSLLLSLASWEACAMGKVPRFYSLCLAFMSFLLVFSLAFHLFDIVFPLSVLLTIFLFFFLPPSQEALRHLAFVIYCLVYISFLGTFFFRLRLIPHWGETLVIYTIVVSKGTDIFAYFTGSFMGKHKWIPRISPGKTWEGLLGGCLGAGGLGVIVHHLVGGSQIFSWYSVFIISIILGVISQLGDLAESFLKRSSGVKDSAQLLPEFGGILDLIDSLLFSGPVVYLLWSLFI
ncbi:MAG: hypothetical protein D6785_04625 [Planctomycetota bacterium]|nr:MAG: hypothetical protein D6785_04625 [Planctomycetota bacterium]